jgi:hypothetical protein
MHNSEQTSEFESAIDLTNYDATVELGQTDGARKRQQTLTELTPSCGVA